MAGDVILAIDNHYLFTVGALKEEISRHKPGTKIMGSSKAATTSDVKVAKPFFRSQEKEIPMNIYQMRHVILAKQIGKRVTPARLKAELKKPQLVELLLLHKITESESCAEGSGYETLPTW
jgi:hypothetical protein